MEIILNLIIGIAALSVVVVIAGIVNLIMRDKKIDPLVGKISFRETMDLVDLPIITFKNNGKKFNFLLDTGANFSTLNHSNLKDLSYLDLDDVGTYSGVDGIESESSFVMMDVSYNDKVYTDMFQVIDLDAAFDSIKAESGITLHGILGNSFFQKYKYVLNFDELVAYPLL